MRKSGKILSVLLCLAMVLSLAPTVAVSYAEVHQIAQTAATFEQLKSLLEADGDANIMLTKDITEYDIPDREEWLEPTLLDPGTTLRDYERDYYKYAPFICLGSGTKTLDLNGHKLEWNLDKRVLNTYFYLFDIPQGAELIMKDSSGNNSGTVEATGTFMGLGRSVSYDNADIAFYNIFCVRGGKLDIRGGNYVGGRSKKSWGYCIVNYGEWEKGDMNGGYGYTGYVWQQINSEVVSLLSGSVDISGGILNARGYRKLFTDRENKTPKLFFERASALRAVSGSVNISGGEFYGRGGANTLNIASAVKINITAGAFETNSLDRVMVPRDWSSGQYKVWRLMIEESWRYKDSDNANAGAGKIGIPERALDMDKGAAGTLAVTRDGKELEFGRWLGRNIDGTTESCSITVSEKDKKTYYPVSTQSASEKQAAKTAITSVNITGNVKRGVKTTADFLKCSTAGVASVETIWIANNEIVSSVQEVGTGSYQLAAYLYAAEGYRFTDSTGITLMGTAPYNKTVSSDGSLLVVVSKPYEIECDHSENKTPELQYNADYHYIECSVCGDVFDVEEHSFDSGVSSGTTTTYTCDDCGFTRTTENGREGVNGVVIEIPTALIGGEVPEPKIADGFKSYAKIVSSEWRKGSENGDAVNPGGSYGSDTYYLKLSVEANEGYYFKSNAVMSSSTGIRQGNNVSDTTLSGVIRINPQESERASIAIPALSPGKSVREVLDGLTGMIGDEETSNWQVAIYPENGEDYGFVKKNLNSESWSFVNGKLTGILDTKIAADTLYRFVVDASTNGAFTAEEDIAFSSGSRLEGYQLMGGETWAEADALILSDSDTISEIAIIDLSEPVRGESPAADFLLMSDAGLDIVSGSWSPAPGNVFAPETAYTFTGKLSLKSGYSFASGVTASVNSHPASVSVSGSTATVTCSFPKTEAATVAASESGAAVSGDNPFVDVADSAYYHDAVLWAYYHEPQVTNGIDTTHFGPMNTVTRGQAMTFLWRAAGCPKPTVSENPFVDVAETSYYRDAVLWAVELGITNGTDAAHFSPNQTCSRGHIITFLYRLAGSPGVAVSTGGKWYEAGMSWAEAEGLSQNLGSGSVNAADDCPRADVVCYLYRQLAK